MKIRINELARELEVKPQRILELLPELGVAEKKTHSSSVDDDVVNKVRGYYGLAPLESGHSSHGETSPPTETEQIEKRKQYDRDRLHHRQETEMNSGGTTPPPVLAPTPVSPAPQVPPVKPTAAAKVEVPEPASKPEPVPSASIPAAIPVPLSAGPLVPPLSRPLRPPLLGQNGPPARVVTAPQTMAVAPAPKRVAPAVTIATPPPAVVSVAPAPVVAAKPVPAAPVAAASPAMPSKPEMPAAPASPAMPETPRMPAPPAPHQLRPLAPPMANRPGGMMGRPVPTGQQTRPGQILTGPRQPLPADLAAGPGAPRIPMIQRPGAPRPSGPSGPGMLGPRPGSAATRPTGPGAPQIPQPPPRPQFQQQAGGGLHSQQPGQRTLAGQPALRPIVPPRPDLVERLKQQQAPPPRSGPGQPAPPPMRPSFPTRPAGPAPGQPIYRGPIRPGQPTMRGPGIPGAPGMGGGPPGLGGPGAYARRGRPQHPTSPLRPETAAPPPTEQQRRHQTKPASRARTRAEIEEGKLRTPYPRRQEQSVQATNKEITISEGITVKELSEKMGVKAADVIKRLVSKKIFATINQTLDAKLAEELARDFGSVTTQVSYEEESTQFIDTVEIDADREKRPPVVTIMGHVDHGKTSLLDAIREANVAAREAGGITQHIGAYRIDYKGNLIAFIDTPGHEAFTRMRARGAKVTDIVILVVAADDGVMPQTIEAIDHAKAAKVPIIVAINKIDKPDAQIDRIKQQLADRGLLAEDWGGDTVMVPVSAKAHTNLDLLLEMVLLVAEMANLRANPARPATGNVLEAKLDKGRGPVATVLVRNGTLNVGDFVICGSVFGKIRAMFNDQGVGVRTADPSMPVEVLGLDSIPEVGDAFQAVIDTAKAKQIVMFREIRQREASLAKSKRVTLETLHDKLREGDVKELNIILKTDVGGTAEVLSDSLQKLSNDKVRLRVLRAGVGAITESDVLLATTSDAIVVGFNVRPERNAVAIAEQEKVDIRLHTIIYNLTDEIKKAMTGMLEPVYKEVYQGRAEVRDVFRITKVGTVAGCYVQDGFIKRDSDVRLLRDNIVVYTGKVDTLKRFKNDASEVKLGFECGIAITNFNDIKAGDIIEAFSTERVAVEVFT